MLQYDSIIWVERILILTKSRGKVLHGKLTDTQFIKKIHYFFMVSIWDRLCGLVVRVPGYRSRAPGFKSWVGLEWGPLRLVSATEELLGRKSSGSSLEIREYGSGDQLCWPHDTL
jgi:hypothetical protein